MITSVYLKRFILDIICKIEKKENKSKSKSLKYKSNSFKNVSLVCWEWFNECSKIIDKIKDNPFEQSLFNESRYSIYQKENIKVYHLNSHLYSYETVTVYLYNAISKMTKYFGDEEQQLLIDKCKQLPNLKYIKTKTYSRDYDSFANQLPPFKVSEYTLDKVDSTIPEPIKKITQICFENEFSDQETIINLFNKFTFKFVSSYDSKSYCQIPFKQIYKSDNKKSLESIKTFTSLSTVSISQMYYLFKGAPSLNCFEFKFCICNLLHQLSTDTPTPYPACQCTDKNKEFNQDNKFKKHFKFISQSLSKITDEKKIIHYCSYFMKPDQTSQIYYQLISDLKRANIIIYQ